MFNKYNMSKLFIEPKNFGFDNMKKDKSNFSFLSTNSFTKNNMDCSNNEVNSSKNISDNFMTNSFTTDYYRFCPCTLVKSNADIIE